MQLRVSRVFTGFFQRLGIQSEGRPTDDPPGVTRKSRHRVVVRSPSLDRCRHLSPASIRIIPTSAKDIADHALVREELGSNAVANSSQSGKYTGARLTLDHPIAISVSVSTGTTSDESSVQASSRTAPATTHQTNRLNASQSGCCSCRPLSKQSSPDHQPPTCWSRRRSSTARPTQSWPRPSGRHQPRAAGK